MLMRSRRLEEVSRNMNQRACLVIHLDRNRRRWCFGGKETYIKRCCRFEQLRAPMFMMCGSRRCIFMFWSMRPTNVSPIRSYDLLMFWAGGVQLCCSLAGNLATLPFLSVNKYGMKDSSKIQEDPTLAARGRQRVVARGLIPA